MPRPFAGIPRLYLMFASGMTVIAGMSFSSRISESQALLLGLAAFLVYGFGSTIAECILGGDCPFLRFITKGGKGSITPTMVMIGSFLGIGGCGAVFAIKQPLNIAVLATGIIGLVVYLFYARRLWIGPWYNVWIVLVLALGGFIATADSVDAVPVGFLWLLGSACAGYISLVLMGYAIAKQARVYPTIGFPLNMSTTSLVVAADVFKSAMVICALIGSFILPLQNSSLTSMLGGIWFLASGAMAIVIPQVTAHANREGNRRPISLTPSIHAYVLCFCGVAALQQPAWFIPLALLYFAFSTLLRATPGEAAFT